MKAVKIFSVCFLYMVVSVSTENVIDQLATETTEGPQIIDSVRREKDLNNNIESFMGNEDDERATAGLSKPSDRIDWFSPPFPTHHSADFNNQLLNSPSNLAGKFHQQPSNPWFGHTDNGAHSQPTSTPQLSLDWSSLLNPSSNQNVQPTPCKNGDTLKRILSSILMMLLNPFKNNSPSIGTINGVLNVLEFQMKSDNLQNVDLYPKLQSLEKTLRAGPPYANNLNEKLMFQNNANIGSPDCDAAFLKLVVLAYTLYKELSKYPDCNECPFPKTGNNLNNPQTGFQHRTPNNEVNSQPYNNFQNPIKPRLYSVPPPPEPLGSYLNYQTTPSPDPQTNYFQNPQEGLPYSQTNPILISEKRPIINYKTYYIQQTQPGLSPGPQINPFQNPQSNPLNSFSNLQPNPNPNYQASSLNSQNMPTQEFKTNSKPDNLVPADSKGNSFFNPQASPGIDSQTNIFQNSQTSPSPNSNSPTFNSQSLPNAQTNSPINPDTNPQPNTDPITRTNVYPNSYLRPQLQPYQNPQENRPISQIYSYPSYQKDPNVNLQSNNHPSSELNYFPSIQRQPYGSNQHNKPYNNILKGEEWSPLRNPVKLFATNESESITQNYSKLDTKETPQKTEIPSKHANLLDKFLRMNYPPSNNLFKDEIDNSEEKSSAEKKFDVSLKHAADLVRKLEDIKQQSTLLLPTSTTKDNKNEHPLPHIQLQSANDGKNVPSDITSPYFIQNHQLQPAFAESKLISPSAVSEPSYQRPIPALKSSYESFTPKSMSLGHIQYPNKSQSQTNLMPNKIYTYILSQLPQRDVRNIPQHVQTNYPQDRALYYPRSINSNPSYSNLYPFFPILREPLQRNVPIAKDPNVFLRQGYPPMSNVPSGAFDHLNSNPHNHNDLLQFYPKHFDSKENLSPCLHTLCDHILTHGYQPNNVVNIFLSSDCKDFSASQKLFLVQLLEHFRIPNSNDETSKQNQKLLKYIIGLLKPNSDKSHIPDDSAANTDKNDIDVPFPLLISQLVESSLNNPEDKQIAYNLVEDTVVKLKSQGIDFNQKENINLLMVFVKNIITQLLVKGDEYSNNAPGPIPGLSPEFSQYLQELLSNLVENPQERQNIMSQLLVYINNLVKQGFDLKKQESINLVITYLNFLVSQQNVTNLTPSEPIRPTVNPKLLELIYKMILSSVSVSQSQGFLTEVKNYIDQLINQGIDLNTPENFELVLNYVNKKIKYQSPIEPTSLPTLSPTPPTPQMNPEFLKNLYELIVTSVNTNEEKQFLFEQLQNYIKELVNKGVDLSKTDNLYNLLSFTRKMIDSIVNPHTTPPPVSMISFPPPRDETSTINREILHYAYDLIRNFISNAHQEEIAVRYFHDFLNKAANSNLDLNNKENIYKVIMSIMDFVKENIDTTSVPDIKSLPLKPHSVDITYILNTKLQYGRSGVVKYRVPFDTFIKNIRDILVRAPMQRSQSNLEGILRSTSNITEVSPELQQIPKDQLINLITRSGSFVDAEISRDDISKFTKNANYQKVIDDFKRMVFKLDEKVNNNYRGLNNPLVESTNVTKEYALRLIPNKNGDKIVNFRRNNDELTPVNELINRDIAKITPDKIVAENELSNIGKNDSIPLEDNINGFNGSINHYNSSDNNTSSVSEVINDAPKKVGIDLQKDKDGNMTVSEPIYVPGSNDNNLLSFRENGDTENATKSDIESSTKQG